MRVVLGIFCGHPHQGGPWAPYCRSCVFTLLALAGFGRVRSAGMHMSTCTALRHRQALRRRRGRRTKRKRKRTVASSAPTEAARGQRKRRGPLLRSRGHRQEAPQTAVSPRRSGVAGSPLDSPPRGARAIASVPKPGGRGRKEPKDHRRGSYNGPCGLTLGPLPPRRRSVRKRRSCA